MTAQVAKKLFKREKIRLRLHQFPRCSHFYDTRNQISIARMRESFFLKPRNLSRFFSSSSSFPTRGSEIALGRAFCTIQDICDLHGHILFSQTISNRDERHKNFREAKKELMTSFFYVSLIGRGKGHIICVCKLQNAFFLLSLFDPYRTRNNNPF